MLMIISSTYPKWHLRLHRQQGFLLLLLIYLIPRNATCQAALGFGIYFQFGANYSRLPSSVFRVNLIDRFVFDEMGEIGYARRTKRLAVGQPFLFIYRK